MADVFMLDTDVSSYIIRETPRGLMDVFVAHKDDLICISVVTYAELLYGLRNRYSERLERKIDNFVFLLVLMDWTDRAARCYAEICHALKKAGTPIGNMDLMIASAAIAADAQLVTNNKKHFERVPNLKIADWLTDAPR